MNDGFKRILLIQFRPIGDVLLSTPLISVLRKRCPEAHIAFMAEPLPGQVLENNPDLDEIIYYRHRKDDIWNSMKFFRSIGRQNWDLAIDIYGTPGTAWAAFFSRAKIKVGYTLRIRKFVYTLKVKHRQPERYSALKKLALLKALGIENESPDLTLRLYDTERDFADDFYLKKEINARKFTVCFAPGAKRQARFWLTHEWARLGNRLKDDCRASVILLWGPGEEEIVNSIAESMENPPHIIPRTDLREMAAIIEKAHLCITHCSGTQHIATAVGVPTITVHGPTSPLTWTFPDPNRHRFVRGNVPCIECNLKFCHHRSCMYDVRAEDIIEEMRHIPEVFDRLPKKYLQ